MKEYKRNLNLKLGALIPLAIVSLLAFFIKSMSVTVLSYLFGASIIIESIFIIYSYVIQRKKVYSIFKLDLVYTVILAILGIYTMINSTTTKIDLTILAGLYFIITALYKLSIPLYINKVNKQMLFIVILNMILSITLAITIFIYPFDYLFFKTQTIGVFALINILLDIMYINILKKNAKSISKLNIKGK